jgi:hypothetical protein
LNREDLSGSIPEILFTYRNSLIVSGVHRGSWSDTNHMPLFGMFRLPEAVMPLVHLDAGHVCQNLYLAAEQINCGACAIGAFDDELMAGLLGIDGVDEFVIYCATVGRKM